MRVHLFTAITLGLLAAACQPADPGLHATSQSPAAAYAASSASSGQACANYGFSSGTAAFDRCVSQEQATRSAGRVNRDYTEARLTDDARNACASYGLQPNSGGYNQCVSREVDDRRYQGTNLASPTARTSTAP